MRRSPPPSAGASGRERWDLTVPATIRRPTALRLPSKGDEVTHVQPDVARQALHAIRVPLEHGYPDPW